MSEYEEFVKTTDVSNHDIQFYLDGMNEENGEISGVFKRIRRGDYGNEIKNNSNGNVKEIIINNENILDDLIKELGDRHWYTTRFLQEIGCSWSEVENVNMQKLRKRKSEGKILGHGDNR